MANTPLTGDLNEMIAAGVNARIEASVLEAMSSDETMARFVTAALSAPVELGNYSSREKTTFIALTVRRAIEEQTKAVVAEEIGGLKEGIRAEVRKALRKSVGVIADSLVDGFVANAEGRYPSIKVEFSGRD